MTWVALVGPEIEENLSLRYIASSLQAAGVRVELVPFNQEADFGTALAAVVSAPEPPALVGISLAFQWRARDFLALAVALRESGYRGHITMGGHFGTFAAQEILADFPEVDSIVRQEAEETVVALCRALEQNTALTAIPGLALRDGDRIVMTAHPPLPDLSKLPRPDRRGEPASCFGHGIAPLVSSRGCYANCSFCCIAAWHEQSLPGKRYRVREVDDVADEMVEMQRQRGVDVFVFHDDNFFVPGHRHNKERFHALADALERRKIGRFATVVKARPTDCDPQVFSVLRDRLHCIRVYIGIETDADQGLRTLRRWAKSSQNHDAIDMVRELDLYTCYNMLIFDPDTTVESLRTNIEFLRYAPEYPSNFGRVELYAGTPLLARMQAEGRVRGDWLQWDYDLGSPEVERIFALAMECFMPRNFGNDALSNRIMGTRFDVEVSRHFYPELYDPAWLAEGKALTRVLMLDGAGALEKIVEFVERRGPASEERAFVAELSAQLRATERVVRERCKALARELMARIGRGRPLTELGGDVATPLQTQRTVGTSVVLAH
ncbi:MAG TPA: cobalamin-dependent protein [Polyangiaceae bacterium]|nr:cobalamin-dependent protein [Polyangiaceae bacterium]